MIQGCHSNNIWWIFKGFLLQNDLNHTVLFVFKLAACSFTSTVLKTPIEIGTTRKTTHEGEVCALLTQYSHGRELQHWKGAARHLPRWPDLYLMMSLGEDVMFINTGLYQLPEAFKV